MKAVLDTNVWLDCLVFADPGVETLHDCIRTGRLVVLGTDEMRDEWIDVVARTRFGLDDASRTEAVLAFDRSTVQRPRAPACPLLCSDRTDRKFVDLAVAESATWLVTKDRALLALARRARERWALTITRPDAPGLLAALAALRAADAQSL